MNPFRLYAATGDAVARIEGQNGEDVVVSLNLAGRGVMCVAVDPHDPDRIFVGTFDLGTYRSLDGGDSWESVGLGMADARVLSIAFSPCEQVAGRPVVYAGTEPSMLYRSTDDGETWQPSPALLELPSAATWSFPPRPHTHHVRWISPHPSDPRTIYIGIELGGVMTSRDGGVTWEDRKPGSLYDSHALATHPLARDHVYEAAGGGIALSIDAGRTWRGADAGMDRHYAWAVAVDAADANLWYVSASPGPALAHHSGGDAQAVIYRKRGDAPWQALGGEGSGIGGTLRAMPYALLTLRDRPRTLIAGLKSGDLLLTENAGDNWRTLQTGLSSIIALSESAV